MRELGRRIAAGQATAGRSRTRALEDRGMELLSRDPALRAALFRLVDVAPACAGPRDLAAHLASLLGEVERPLAPVSVARRASLRPVDAAARSAASRASPCTGWPSASSSAQGPAEAVPALERLWRAGAAASVDLLGEATVTAAEADRYAQRCDEALRTLAQRRAQLAARPRSSRLARPSRA